MYHAPKIKELELKGMEGSVKSIVKKYKGKETSANLPYRIEFMLEKEDGKQQKFFAHVVRDLALLGKSSCISRLHPPASI